MTSRLYERIGLRVDSLKIYLINNRLEFTFDISMSLLFQTISSSFPTKARPIKVIWSYHQFGHRWKPNSRQCSEAKHPEMTNPGKLTPLLQCKQAPGAKLAVALEPFLAWSHSQLQDDLEAGERGANMNISTVCPIILVRTGSSCWVDTWWNFYR